MSNKDFFKYTQSPEFLELLTKYEEGQNSGADVYIDFEDLIDIAEYYHFTENPTKVNEVLQCCHRLYPDNPITTVFEARMYMLHYQDYATAERLLLSDNTDKETFEWTMVMGELHILQNRLSDANEIFCKKYNSLKQEASQTDNTIDSGSMEEEEERHNQLEDLRFFPLDVAMLYMQHNILDYAEEWLKAITDIKSDMEYDYWDTYSRIAMGCEVYDKAIEYWNKLLDIDPYNSEAWIQLSDCQFHKGNTKEALQSVEFALAITPANPDALITKSFYLQAQGQHDEALDTLRKCTDANPMTAVVEIYRAALEYDPADTEAFLNKLHSIEADDVTKTNAACFIYEMSMTEIAYTMLTDILQAYKESGNIDDCPLEVLNYLVKCCSHMGHPLEQLKYLQYIEQRHRKQ